MRVDSIAKLFLIIGGGSIFVPSDLRAGETVFVQFEGQTLIPIPPGGQDNAALGQSQALNRLNLSELQVPPFVQPAGFDRQQFIQIVLSTVAEYWLGIDVRFSANRPTDDNYTMIVVGGSAALLNGLTDAGWAPNDCHNQSPHEVAYVFSETIQELFGTIDPNRLAATISAEYAHTVGLEHITGSDDMIMQPVILNSSYYGFGRECLPIVGAFPPSHPEYCDEHPGCEQGRQNDWMHLLDRIGPAVPSDSDSTAGSTQGSGGTSAGSTGNSASSTGLDSMGTGGGEESAGPNPVDDDGGAGSSCNCRIQSPRDWIWSALVIFIVAFVRRRTVSK